jgi:Ca2+-binding RTX toxin-like protein
LNILVVRLSKNIYIYINIGILLNSVSRILLLMQGPIIPIAAMLLFAGLLVPVTTVAVWAEHVNDNNNYDKDDIPSIFKEGNIIKGRLLIVGTDDKDFIVGSVSDDTIFAKKANDEIQSSDGMDQVFAAQGSDTIQSGAGNDQVFGEEGDDNIVGGFQDDFVDGGSGNDHLFAGFGDDQLKGGSGADYFNCGEDTDEVKDFKPEQGDLVEPNCEIVR